MSKFSFLSKKSLLFVTLLIACGHIQKVQSGAVHVMVYNVENLFDTQHDEGKNDFTYLPKNFPGKKAECEKIDYARYRKECLKTDWSQTHLALKISQIEKVIAAYQKDHKVQPALLGLVEVENQNVVAQLATKLGYSKFVVSNSPDKRGVDVALLYHESSKLKLINSKELVIQGEHFKQRPTRNILEAQFLVGGKYKLFVYVNHWPSLGNPTEARLAAAQTLSERIRLLKEKDSSAHFMAIGDFNTIPENYPHPFHSFIFKDGLMNDVHTSFMEDQKIAWNIKNGFPPGTYFYAKKMQWNLLDRIFYDANLKDTKGLELQHKSYQIFSKPFMTTSYIYQQKGDYLAGSQVQNIPKRYQHHLSAPSKQGFSDHFPLVVQLSY